MASPHYRPAACGTLGLCHEAESVLSQITSGALVTLAGEVVRIRRSVHQSPIDSQASGIAPPHRTPLLGNCAAEFLGMSLPLFVIRNLWARTPRRTGAARRNGPADKGCSVPSYAGAPAAAAER